MTKIVITQSHRWFVVDVGDSRMHILNGNSLHYFLRRTLGLDKQAEQSVNQSLLSEGRCELVLESTERVAS